VAAQDQALQTKYYATEILETKKDSEADYVASLRRQYTTLCQRAKYWQKNNTSNDMTVCAQLQEGTVRN
jgi:hypothetical protein